MTKNEDDLEKGASMSQLVNIQRENEKCNLLSCSAEMSEDNFPKISR